MSSVMQALQVTGISMPVIFAVMAALWSLIVIIRSLFPERDDEGQAD